MSTDEVIVELKKRGINVSQKTLLRLAKEEIIPLHRRVTLGFDIWINEYPDETVNSVERALSASHPVIDYWRDRALEAEAKLNKVNL